MKNSVTTFILRSSAELRNRIINEAKIAGVSANNFCINLLQRGLESNAETSGSAAPMLDLGNNMLNQILDTIGKTIIPRFGDSLAGVVLFGSAARGVMRENSDIGLLIILSSEITIDRDDYDHFPRIIIENHEVSPLLVTMPNSGQELRTVWLEAALDGLVLYDPALAVARLFGFIRNEIAQGKISRQFSYGIPYWVREEEKAQGGQHHA